jgi:DNA-binding FrmR family transcriptional regulator
MRNRPNESGRRRADSNILALDTREGYNGRMTTPAISDPTRDQKDETIGSDRRSTSYAADKTKILARLRRIEGQVRGVQKMVEQDQYCLDILTQLSAIIAAARTTGLLVLEDHIRGCVVNASDDDREAVLAELNEAIERFTRTVG